MKTIYFLCSYNPAQYCKNEWDKSFIIKGYFYQKSLFAFNSAPINFDYSDVEVENSWAKEHVYDDLTKKYVSDILQDVSDYIFIDALSCVVPLRQISVAKTNSLVTNNKYMQEACNNLVKKKKISLGEIVTELTEEQLKESVCGFCDTLLSKYKQEQIIVHKANYAESYLYGKKVAVCSTFVKSNRKHMHDRLKKIYQIMEMHMPDAHFIDMLSTVSSTGLDKPFDYSADYAKYLTNVSLSIIYPENAGKLMRSVYETMFENLNAQNKLEDSDADFLQLLNKYQYKLEILNRKLNEYDGLVIDACNSINGSSYKVKKQSDTELSYDDFLVIRKSNFHYSKLHSGILWQTLVFPFTKIKNYLKYIHNYGFIYATKAAVRYYKAYLKNISIMKGGKKK